MKSLKSVWTIGAGVGICLFSLAIPEFAGAQNPDYPIKPINFYISFSPGGTTDLATRAFLDAASKHLGQPFIPINRPGASGAIAAMAAMTAKPDGYTLANAIGSSHCVAPFSEDAPYKDLSGFTMLVNFGTYVTPLIVRSDSPWKTWREFLEWAQKKPRSAKVGITGAVTVDIKGMYLWRIGKKEKVEFTFVAFKGSPEILAATLGGHITLYGSVVDSSTMPHLQEGKLRILLYTSKEKISGYENIPSSHELYGLSVPLFMGICGPKALPDYVLRKLDDAFAKAAKDPQFISMMNRMYTPVVYMKRGDFKDYVDRTYNQMAEWMKIYRAEETQHKN